MDSSQALTFHESFGTVTRQQLATYRSANVSQSDHDDLADYFGEDRHDDIVQFVRQSAAKHNGMYQSFDLTQRRWNR